MEKRFKQYAGIHPGIVLERELKKRAVRQRPFALSLAEHPQTFNSIIKGKRNLSTNLALKIERALKLEEGTLVLLQAWYDIRKAKETDKSHTPDLARIRTALFWDTDIERIDWDRQYKAVIQRIFERGDEGEQDEIIRFYGRVKVESVLAGMASQDTALRSQKP